MKLHTDIQVQNPWTLKQIIWSLPHLFSSSQFWLNRAWPYEDLKVSDLQANANLTKKILEIDSKT